MVIKARKSLKRKKKVVWITLYPTNFGVHQPAQRIHQREGSSGCHKTCCAVAGWSWNCSSRSLDQRRKVGSWSRRCSSFRRRRAAGWPGACSRSDWRRVDGWTASCSYSGRRESVGGALTGAYSRLSRKRMVEGVWWLGSCLPWLIVVVSSDRSRWCKYIVMRKVDGWIEYSDERVRRVNRSWGWKVLRETSAELSGTILAGGQISAWGRSFLKSRRVVCICGEWVQVYFYPKKVMEEERCLITQYMIFR